MTQSRLVPLPSLTPRRQRVYLTTAPAPSQQMATKRKRQMMSFIMKIAATSQTP